MNRKSNMTLVLRLMAVALCLLLPAAMYAQLITVKGTVVDAKGEPLIGVSVMTNSGSGAATDIDGTYSVKADAKGTIAFSYVGYKSLTVNVDGQSTINVTMNEDAAVLDELVVVGYGQMKKKDLTGAVSSLGGKDIKDVPVNNVGQAIQGKVAGVQIIDANKPGDNVSIKIRGLGSINNCDPLVVIDGVPTDLGLNSLNPQDIDRLDVLKDA